MLISKQNLEQFGTFIEFLDSNLINLIILE